MPDVHTIRLRGPWTMEWAGQPARRVKLPARRSRVLGRDETGRAVFCRSFQRPTGLEPQETTYLVVDTPWPLVKVVLNDVVLDIVRIDRHQRPAWPRADVTDRLADTNRLAVEVDYPPGAASDVDAPLLGEVWLEIHGVG